MIKLEAIQDKDYETLVKWNEQKDADFLLQWAGPAYVHPLTSDQIRQHVLDIRKEEPAGEVYKIMDADSDCMLGTIEIRAKNFSIGRVGRFLIGDECCRGRGIGEEALLEAIRIGFEYHGFSEITLGVFDFNVGAVKCYEKAGFHIKECKMDFRKASDGFWNLYEMGISIEEWKQQKINSIER